MIQYLRWENDVEIYGIYKIIFTRNFTFIRDMRILSYVYKKLPTPWGVIFGLASFPDVRQS